VEVNVIERRLIMWRGMLGGIGMGLMLALSAGAQETATEEMPWFDVEHCAFCKNMAEQEGLLEATQCETHKISDGMIMVSLFPDEFKEASRRANEAMQQTASQLQSGQPLPVCGFCQQIGSMMAQGVTIQKIVGDHCELSLFTSHDPTVVKTIHAFADRVIKEIAAMPKRHAPAR
ncbi:MAG TPA: hypothetical protein VIY86_14720, partial [Pirellulaceae bacterium]